MMGIAEVRRSKGQGREQGLSEHILSKQSAKAPFHRRCRLGANSDKRRRSQTEHTKKKKEEQIKGNQGIPEDPGKGVTHPRGSTSPEQTNK